MSGSFIERKIDVTFTLVAGAKFVESGTNSVTLSGLRVSANVNLSGEAMAELHLRIFGLTLSMINQLTTLGRKKALGMMNKNIVSVAAGDDVSGMAPVFTGTIAEAYADFEDMPDTAFTLSAFGGLFQAVAPAPPTSIQGSGDVATIMGQLAKQMGLTLENNGVDTKIANPYFPGTAWVQADECARAADIRWTVDRDILAIWPKNSYRPGTGALISPTTGLVGYPAFTDIGIVVTVLFNPAIKYGALIEVQSSLTPACGKWAIYGMQHELESQTVGGSWFSRISATDQGLVIK